MPEDTPINGAVYINILKRKLACLYVINRFARFQDTACHPTKEDWKWINNNEFQIPGPWHGNPPDLHPIKNKLLHVILVHFLNCGQSKNLG